MVTSQQKKVLKQQICRNCIHWIEGCQKCKKRKIRTGPNYSCDSFINKYNV